MADPCPISKSLVITCTKRGCRNENEYNAFHLSLPTRAYIHCRNFFCNYRWNVPLPTYEQTPITNCVVCNSQNITIEYVRFDAIVPPTKALNGTAKNIPFYSAIYFMFYQREVSPY
jgi:hypothetical protein